MANQIIHCPPPLLGPLLAALESYRAQDAAPVSLHPMGGRHGFDAVCVKVRDPRLVLSMNTHARSATFTLLLTSQQHPSPSYQPLPLPDDLVCEMLDLLAWTLAAIDSLTGHERLELAELCVQARTAPNRAPLPHRPRRAENDYERRLRTKALRLQDRLAPQLLAFDQALAEFRGRALRSRLSPILRALSTEGPVADALRLKRLDQNRFALDLEPGAQGSFLNLRRRAAADRLTLEAARAASAVYEFGAQSCTGPTALLNLSRGASVDDQWRQPGLWRAGPPELEPGLPPPLAAEEVSTVMRYYCPAFDWRLLARVHPLIIAALAALEFCRVAPFPRGNRRVAELLLTTLIEERTAAPLPIMMVLYRRRSEFQSGLMAATKLGQPEGFVAVVADLALEAIAVGNRLLDELSPAFATLTRALVDDNFEMHQAGLAVNGLLAAVLTERGEDDIALRSYQPNSEAAAQALHRRGLLDKVEAACAGLWSAPTIRNLLKTG